MVTAAWIVNLDSAPLAAAVDSWRDRLADAGIRDAGEPGAAADLDAADVVIVWADRPLEPGLIRALADPGVRVLLAGPSLTDADPDGILADAAGLHPGPRSPQHDVRVRAAREGQHLLAAAHVHGDHAHYDEHEHVLGTVATVVGVADDVRVLRTARVGLADHPVMTWRPSTATAAWTLGTTPEAIVDRTTTRLLVQVLREMADLPAPQPVRVGLLGYGAIGHEHSRAVRAVDGLTLTAVCDTSLGRLDEAEAAAPGVARTTSADSLLERDDVDLVVVSTPPSSHAHWALRALEAGKHVVVEKPFAIRTAEADDVLAAARDAGLLAVVYQNRRFDPDHLAIRRMLDRGAIGDLFHVETFVGGYGHPCNLWHSDQGVSGGAFYDWGSHLLDQVLDLIPTPIDYVTAAAHKRAWFDVTNSDHSRVTVRFIDGVEAEFTHSDLAAALKPRWYLLGTRGAIVGHWRAERIVSRSDIGTLIEDRLSPADAPPALELHAADGSVTHVASPAGPEYPFHRELADHLLFGLSMTVTGEQSRRVLSVMEAASASAADNARPVVPL
ncbi:MAG TPA: Gfo/Idh/MocA family oxidoreductase [Motilibacterales bacterium]|nr:Gfo/Idh/MocA family oxidoreductase [Motilibacterales bacterium]